MRQSAGILPFRRKGNEIEVLLLHPAGPFWAKKDSWHFPKGELDEGEDWLTAARREFYEEVGVPVPEGELIDLGEAKQPNKQNHVWALEAEVDLSRFADTISTNVFTMEWPPHSGKQEVFPENDRAQWFSLHEAHAKVFGYLQIFLERLADHLQVSIAAPAKPEQQSLL